MMDDGWPFVPTEESTNRIESASVSGLFSVTYHNFSQRSGHTRCLIDYQPDALWRVFVEVPDLTGDSSQSTGWQILAGTSAATAAIVRSVGC